MGNVTICDDYFNSVKVHLKIYLLFYNMTFIDKDDNEPENEFDNTWFNYIWKFNICVICYGFIQHYFS